MSTRFARARIATICLALVTVGAISSTSPTFASAGNKVAYDYHLGEDLGRWSRSRLHLRDRYYGELPQHRLEDRQIRRHPMHRRHQRRGEGHQQECEVGHQGEEARNGPV